MSVEDLIKTVMEEFRQIVKTETVVGEPIKVEDSVIVPVSKISFGFGAGGGGQESEESGKGSGTGGGATVEPIAFVVVTDGKAQVVPLKKKEAAFWKVVELAPEILSKVKDFKEKRERKKGKEKEDSGSGKEEEDS